MIIVKEEDGVLLAADIGPSKSPTAPGDILQAWTPIGPGTKPIVSWDGTTYYIAFEYLGHAYVRKVDGTVWPPQVIDPVVYSDHFVSIEEPHDALAMGYSSDVSTPRVFDRPLSGDGLLQRMSGLIYDVDTSSYSTTISRDTSTNPTPATRKAWRVYQRAIGATTWVMIQDWVTEIPTLTISGVGELRVELACTYGHLWTPESRNADPANTGLYLESALGAVLTIDSQVESKTILQAPASQSPVDSQGPSAPGGATFTPAVSFFSQTQAETLGVDTGGVSTTGQADMGQKSVFVALPQEVADTQTAVTQGPTTPVSALIYS